MLWLLSGPGGFTCWITLLRFLVLCTVEFLYLLGLFYILIYMSADLRKVVLKAFKQLLHTVRYI